MPSSPVLAILHTQLRKATNTHARTLILFQSGCKRTERSHSSSSGSCREGRKRLWYLLTEREGLELDHEPVLFGKSRLAH